VTGRSVLSCRLLCCVSLLVSLSVVSVVTMEIHSVHREMKRERDRDRWIDRVSVSLSIVSASLSTQPLSLSLLLSLFVYVCVCVCYRSIFQICASLPSKAK
jgi:Na+/glutamate symporter